MLDQPNGSGQLVWPTDDFTRTPYEVYASDGIFAREQEKIFNGPTWVILGLECEVAEPGSFSCSCVGTTPVVLSRGEDGELFAFVNKCAHRGARVVRELRGRSLTHTCLYHGWVYGTNGDLKAAPLSNGLMGQGGYPEGFRTEDHCLQKLQVDTHAGIVFGSLHPSPPSLHDYLGDAVRDRLSTICHSPLKVWGYQRQTMACNWKLFMENTRDMYHAPMLHAFATKYGLVNPTKQQHALRFENDGAHQVYSTIEMDRDTDGKAASGGAMESPLQLEDPRVAEGVGELPDGLYVNIISIFPATLFTVAANTLSFRQVRPISPGKCETVYTWFQYEDDDEEMHERRVMQSNLFGPGGYVAMEDAEVMESTQKSIARGYEAGSTFVEMGGGTIAEENHPVTEASVRSFWKNYCKYMDIPTPSAQAAE